jgi:hypothetical protein
MNGYKILGPQESNKKGIDNKILLIPNIIKY